MTRTRFEEILRFLHVSDNLELNAIDTFSKIRPLLCWLNERWLLLSPTKKHLSTDKSMVPYYGRHDTKQHIHGKPIRFGYKLWSRTASAGYMLQCEPLPGVHQPVLEFEP